jgi:hypothetical protein
MLAAMGSGPIPAAPDLSALPVIPGRSGAVRGAHWREPPAQATRSAAVGSATVRRSTPSGSAVPAGIAAEAATAAPRRRAVTSGSRCAGPASRTGFTVRPLLHLRPRPTACLRRQHSAMPAGAGDSLNSECRWRRPLTPRPAGMRLSNPHRLNRRHCRRSRSRRPRRHGSGRRRRSPRSSRGR